MFLIYYEEIIIMAKFLDDVVEYIDDIVQNFLDKVENKISHICM